MKFFIIVSMTIGLMAGNYIPLFWGGSAFSLTAVFLSTVGGSLGCWFGYKTSVKMGL